MEMHWHWLIVIYLFLGGLGAGSYLTSFASEMGWLGKNSSLHRVGYFIAAPIVAIGTVLLIFDLGQGLTKPWLLIGLLANFSSVMTWGVYILSAFIMVGLLKGFLIFRKKSVPVAITWAGAILALATGTYTGLLLAAVKAIPFWSTGIMPVLFVVSALSTGLSLTSLLAHFVEKEQINENRETLIHLSLTVAELIIVATFLGMMYTGVNGPVGKASAMMVMFGEYSVIFWGLFLGLGLLFPFLSFTIQYLRSRKAGAVQYLAAREIAPAFPTHQNSILTIISDVSVLIGGFVLRMLIVFAALPIWDGKTIF